MTRLEEAGDIVVVLIACPDEATAGVIARALVEERLAACVSATADARSVYHWRGSIEEAGERLLVAKARADRLDALATRVVELHPYEVPEILALPVARAFGPYLEWLRSEGG